MHREAGSSHVDTKTAFSPHLQDFRNPAAARERYLHVLIYSGVFTGLPKPTNQANKQLEFLLNR